MSLQWLKDPPMMGAADQQWALYVVAANGTRIRRVCTVRHSSTFECFVVHFLGSDIIAGETPDQALAKVRTACKRDLAGRRPPPPPIPWCYGREGSARRVRSGHKSLKYWAQSRIKQISFRLVEEIA